MTNLSREIKYLGMGVRETYKIYYGVVTATYTV